MAHKLDRLTIQGFKSIRDLSDFELKDINILIGSNGAGKSNFVSFFRMLSMMMDGYLSNYIRENGGISDVLYNGRKTTEKMFFETRFGKHGHRFNIVPDAKEGFAITDEARYYAHGTTGWWFLGGSDDGKSKLAKEVKAKHPDAKYSQPVYDAIKSWQIYHFHDTSEQAKMRHAEIIQNSIKLDSNGSNIAPFLLALKKCRDGETTLLHKKDGYCVKESQIPAYDEIVNAIRLVIPFFDDFVLEPQEFGQAKKVSLTWRQKGTDYPMQPYHLSDGSIRFICLATSLLQPHPPSTIIIDEPELGLHPEAIAVLAELIKSAAQHTQVIISTQSPALINHFAIDDIITVNRKDGESVFERMQSADFSVWLEDYSVGDLWEKNIITGGSRHE